MPVPVKKESLTTKAFDQRIDPALRNPETELLRTVKKLEEPSKAVLPPDSCDVLVFRDGSEIQSKVQEVGVSEIRYKRCDNLEGPTYMTKKSDLFMIKFANGTREVMKAEPQVQKPLPAASPGRQPLNRSRQRVTDSQAVSGLVAAIASIVLAFISMFIFIPAYAVLLLLASLILAISAIVLSKRAMNRIKEQPDIYKGKGLAIPANIIGWIMVGFYALVALVFLLIFLTI